MAWRVIGVAFLPHSERLCSRVRAPLSSPHSASVVDGRSVVRAFAPRRAVPRYGRPLAEALKEELGETKNFGRATLAWIGALQDPSEGLERLTEQATNEPIPSE